MPRGVLQECDTGTRTAIDPNGEIHQGERGEEIER